MITFTFALLFMFSIVTVSKVEAYPFVEVTGIANPDASNIAYSTIGGIDYATLDVTYVFSVTAADFGAQMNGLNLEFEADVFAAVNSVDAFAPSDWSGSLLTSGSGNIYEIASAGTFIGVGDSLSFTANVTMFADALSEISGLWGDWSEGGIWEQSFTALDTLGGADGGSTTPVPEPGTIALLGIGLAGLVGASVRRKMKKNVD